MDSYTFRLHSGQREIYREEILAMTKADAVDLAESALVSAKRLRTWTTAALADEFGSVVWEVARPIDTRDETAPPE